MTEINDGGPAFPELNPNYGFNKGMSLRDWFAGMALQGMISSTYLKDEGIEGGVVWGGDDADCEIHSATAYRYADAMLKARGK